MSERKSLTQKDIAKYAEEFTDFAFEMRVLRAFQSAGCEAEHGGTYVDPVTKKNREFDLRVKAAMTKFPLTTLLSVECKNISPAFPLIVQSVQRTRSESFHDIIHYSMNGSQPQVARQSLPNSLYKPNVWVAKSFDQVGLKKDGELVSSEGKTYDKMSQAINSAEALIRRCEPARDQNRDVRYLVIPVLVVPDSGLWEIKYSEDGLVVGSPEQVKQAQYYINLSWMVDFNGMYEPYTISHLEIITLSAVKDLVRRFGCEDDLECVGLFRLGT